MGVLEECHCMAYNTRNIAISNCQLAFSLDTEEIAIYLGLKAPSQSVRWRHWSHSRSPIQTHSHGVQYGTSFGSQGYRAGRIVKVHSLQKSNSANRASVVESARFSCKFAAESSHDSLGPTASRIIIESRAQAEGDSQFRRWAARGRNDSVRLIGLHFFLKRRS